MEKIWSCVCRKNRHGCCEYDSKEGEGEEG